MPEISIVAVENKRQQKQFMQFAWELYAGDPLWIPPLRQNHREMLNYDPHPFYDNNPIQTFIALKDGKVAGRVAALINKDHNERYKENRGFFGFFECINDQEVCGALFDTARAWLKEHGIEQVRGPANPSLNHECGMLVDGFDESPMFMMTYNPSYYPKLLEDYGFRKVEDMYAFWGHIDMLETLDPKLKFIADESKRRFDVQLRRFDKKNFDKDVRSFLDVYNKSLVGTWGFVPMTEAEMEHSSKGLKQLIIPELTTICEIDGKVIGSVFGLLDYNPRIKLIDGKLFPFGFIRLLWNRKKIDRLRLLSANVVPEYQRWGIGLVILDRLVPDLKAWGIKEVEFSWVLESNHLSRSSLERGGAKRTKTYRMYDYGPAEDAAAE
ncbi:MAG: N-acetyltransferase [Blastopirellula sp.]|nr:MAG: N-acetyltransferase [Blastopirellula sp.]